MIFRKKIACRLEKGRSIKTDVVSRVLDAVQERCIGNWKFPVADGGGLVRGRPAGRKKDLSLTPCHTTHIHTRTLHAADHHFFISYRSERNRSSWSAEIFATRVGIIYRVIISPENWIVGLQRAGGNVHIRKYAHTCKCRDCVFVARQIGYSWIVVWLIVSESHFCGNCARGSLFSAHPLLFPFPPNKRESNSSPEAISSPVYFHLHPT